MTDKKFLYSILLCSLSIAAYIPARGYSQVWKEAPAKQMPTAGTRYLFPDAYQLYQLDTRSMKSALGKLPIDEAGGQIIELPTPDGSYKAFRVWQTQVLHPELAARYPDIKTFSAVAADDAGISAKIDYTPAGIHAMVFGRNGTYFIDPYSNVEDGNYICYYKQDYTRQHADFIPCSVGEEANAIGGERIRMAGNGNTPLQFKSNGFSKRVYRLALACTVEYSIAVAGANPAKQAVLAAMVTTMNRVNGIYERELAITMQLIANNDQIIYIANPDPYTNSNGPTMQNENQANLNSVIGPLNYDIGHVFSTGGGGIADLKSVCNLTTKAKGVTGQSSPVGDPFDLDYVAHEIGHQFGATHTFNASSGACNGNGDIANAFEPGSGSTLMAYAGICGSNNNLQQHSSDYFHSTSLDQITDFISLAGGTCASVAASGNNPPSVPSFTQAYYIPYLTPFELTAPEATDADNNGLTYCWEEWDLGNFGSDFGATTIGPIFRSFSPTADRTRIFPALEKLLANVTSYTGEKLPTLSRDIVFRLTVRDVFNGSGSFNLPDDNIILHVVNTGNPFQVTAPNFSFSYWQMGSTVQISWDVANTTTAPINCSNVDILLSLDGGRTFTETLAANTPNDGTESIVVPYKPTSSARVKIKGVNNVFFDLSNADFIINSWSAGIQDASGKTGVSIYPLPAKDILYIDLEKASQYQVEVYTALGQKLYSDHASLNKISINIGGWLPGIYNLQITDQETGRRTVQKFTKQ